MLRIVVGTLVLPFFLLAALGCGGSGGAEGPKVESPTLKAKPVKLKGSGEDGASAKAE